MKEKNSISGRMMYCIKGGGYRNGLINLYYTNANSLKYNSRHPKLEVATESLKKADIDFNVDKSETSISGGIEKPMDH